MYLIHTNPALSLERVYAKSRDHSVLNRRHGTSPPSGRAATRGRAGESRTSRRLRGGRPRQCVPSGQPCSGSGALAASVAASSPPETVSPGRSSVQIPLRKTLRVIVFQLRSTNKSRKYFWDK